MPSTTTGPIDTNTFTGTAEPTAQSQFWSGSSTSAQSQQQTGQTAGQQANVYNPHQQGLQAQTSSALANVLSGGEIGANFGVGDAGYESLANAYKEHLAPMYAAQYGAGSPVIGSRLALMMQDLAANDAQMRGTNFNNTIGNAGRLAYTPIGVNSAQQDAANMDQQAATSWQQNNSLIGGMLSSIINFAGAGGNFPLLPFSGGQLNAPNLPIYDPPIDLSNPNNPGGSGGSGTGGGTGTTGGSTSGGGGTSGNVTGQVVQQPVWKAPKTGTGGGGTSQPATPAPPVWQAAAGGGYYDATGRIQGVIQQDQLAQYGGTYANGSSVMNSQPAQQAYYYSPPVQHAGAGGQATSSSFGNALSLDQALGLLAQGLPIVMSDFGSAQMAQNNPYYTVDSYSDPLFQTQLGVSGKILSPGFSGGTEYGIAEAARRQQGAYTPTISTAGTLPISQAGAQQQQYMAANRPAAQTSSRASASDLARIAANTDTLAQSHPMLQGLDPNSQQYKDMRALLGLVNGDPLYRYDSNFSPNKFLQEDPEIYNIYQKIQKYNALPYDQQQYLRSINSPDAPTNAEIIALQAYPQRYLDSHPQLQAEMRKYMDQAYDAYGQLLMDTNVTGSNYLQGAAILSNKTFYDPYAGKLALPEGNQLAREMLSLQHRGVTPNQTLLDFANFVDFMGNPNAKGFSMGYKSNFGGGPGAPQFIEEDSPEFTQPIYDSTGKLIGHRISPDYYKDVHGVPLDFRSPDPLRRPSTDRTGTTWSSGDPIGMDAHQGKVPGLPTVEEREMVDALDWRALGPGNQNRKTGTEYTLDGMPGYTPERGANYSPSDNSAYFPGVYSRQQGLVDPSTDKLYDAPAYDPLEPGLQASQQVFGPDGQILTLPPGMSYQDVFPDPLTYYGEGESDGYQAGGIIPYPNKVTGRDYNTNKSFWGSTHLPMTGHQFDPMTAGQIDAMMRGLAPMPPLPAPLPMSNPIPAFKN